MKKLEIVSIKDHYYLLLPKYALAIGFFNDFLEHIHSTGIFLQQRFNAPENLMDIIPFPCYCVELRGENGQKLDVFLYQMAETFVNSRIDVALENSWANQS